MTTDTFTPPDMRMMLVAHRALHRDLDRMHGVLAGPDQDSSYRRIFREHFGFWLWLIRRHLAAEALGLRPGLRARSGQTTELLDRMDVEDQHLAELLAQADRAIGEWTVSGSRAHRLRAGQTLSSLAEQLNDHVAREESDVLPLIEQFLPDQEWRRIDKDHLRVGLRKLSFLAPWYLDDLDPQLIPAWTDHLPAPIWWIQRHRWQPAYKRRTESLWRPLTTT